MERSSKYFASGGFPRAIPRPRDCANCNGSGLAQASFRSRPHPIAQPRVSLLGAGCMLHLFGELAAGVYASGFPLFWFWQELIWTLWGFGRLRSLTLPMLLLIAALPLPSLAAVSLSMPLQLLASRVACWIADQGGIAVYREGNIIHLAGISVGVWEACSGLNSLSALMAGAILLGFLLCRLSLTRMLLVSRRYQYP